MNTPSPAYAVKLAKTALSLASSGSADVTAFAAALAEFESLVESDFIHKVGEFGIGPLLVLADPIQPMELATKNYVDTLGAGTRIVEFFTATNPWTVTHNKGKYPSSVRILAQIASSPGNLFEFFAQTVESSLNATTINFAANYTGQAILEF